MNSEWDAKEKRAFAERIRYACLCAALDAYEQGGLAGLCEAGRWGLAVDAIRALDVQTLLEDATTSEMEKLAKD